MSKKHALLIGTSQYNDPLMTGLSVPEKDVRAFEAILKDKKVCAFDDVQILINPALSHLTRVISELFIEKRKDDLVMLYLSGHGLRDSDGELYFALEETQLNNPFGTALHASFVKRMMNKSKSRRQLLVLDCCFSGAFVEGTKGLGLQAVSPETFGVVDGYGREVLTSSGPTQLSWEGNAITGATDKSLFTHYLVEGLKTGKAAPEEKEITVEQFYQYAHDHVVDDTPEMKPERSVARGQGRFVFARNPHPVVKPTTLPKDIRQALESSSPFSREGAIRELGRWVQNREPSKVLAVNAVLRELKIREKHTDILKAISFLEQGLQEGPRKSLETEMHPSASEPQPLPSPEISSRMWPLVTVLVVILIVVGTALWRTRESLEVANAKDRVEKGRKLEIEKEKLREESQKLEKEKSRQKEKNRSIELKRKALQEEAQNMKQDKARVHGVALGSDTPEEIVERMTCFACHKIPGISIARTGMIGPLLIEGTNAPNRIKSPEYLQRVREGRAHATTQREYIIESIIDPGAFIVPGFADDMIKDFKHKFTISGLDVLLDHLLLQTVETARADGLDRLPNEKEGSIQNR